MIRAYPGQASVWPGGTLTLHVSTDSPRFRVAFQRWSDGPELLQRSDWLPGVQAEARAADQDWAWPAYTFAIPAGWPSGSPARAPSPWPRSRPALPSAVSRRGV